MTGDDHDSAALRDHILSTLAHPEAEDGLYFRNFFLLHEEDERNAVEADPVSILAVLYDLIDEGKVEMKGEGDEAIFSLSKR